MNPHQIKWPFLVFCHLQLLFCSDALQKVSLQQCFIFKNTHGKEFNRFLITKIKLLSCWRDNNELYKCFPKIMCTSATICHTMVAGDLSLFSFPTSAKWAQYTDNTMLTCKDFTSAAGHLQALLRNICEEEDGQWTQRKFNAYTLLEVLRYDLVS